MFWQNFIFWQVWGLLLAASLLFFVLELAADQMYPKPKVYPKLQAVENVYPKPQINIGMHLPSKVTGYID